MKVQPIDQYSLIKEAEQKASELPDYPFMGEEERLLYILSIIVNRISEKINELIEANDDRGSKDK